MSEQFFSISERTGGKNTCGYKIDASDPRVFYITWTLAIQPGSFMETHVRADLQGALSLTKDEGAMLKVALDRWLTYEPPKLRTGNAQ